jgi:hypothetical protein
VYRLNSRAQLVEAEGVASEIVLELSPGQFVEFMDLFSGFAARPCRETHKLLLNHEVHDLVMKRVEDHYETIPTFFHPVGDGLKEKFWLLFSVTFIHSFFKVRSETFFLNVTGAPEQR